MMPHMYGTTFSGDARSASSPEVVQPPCDAFRISAAILLLVQHVVPSIAGELAGLEFIAHLGFALSGFLMAAYLLRERDEIAEPPAVRSRASGGSWVETLGRIMPFRYSVLALATALCLPGLMALAGHADSAASDPLTCLERAVARCLADLERLPIDSWCRIIWPVAAILAPRRLFLPMIMTTLCSGSMSHLWSLLEPDVQPASILLGPSPFDLLAAGTLLGMAAHRGDSRSRGIVLRTLPTALAMAAGLVGVHFWDHSRGLGSIPFLNAPKGFGLANFLLELSATVLVISVSCQYILERYERDDRSWTG